MHAPLSTLLPHISSGEMEGNVQLFFTKTKKNKKIKPNKVNEKYTSKNALIKIANLQRGLSLPCSK